ncbi:hypothetical protein NA57DRAFT_72802 [Rhizodiscina lignyota]|uniref:Uncharacterized protein n=1 Tax=Rhizodiscina lignyota TaxID=1504668 RepID=A0A9P4IL24_9PEZI|nr:hypothetical protein NA57DRAFT_72802 [Rhizodiscina lignyota]
MSMIHDYTNEEKCQKKQEKVHQFLCTHIMELPNLPTRFARVIIFPVESPKPVWRWLEVSEDPEGFLNSSETKPNVLKEIFGDRAFQALLEPPFMRKRMDPTHYRLMNRRKEGVLSIYWVTQPNAVASGYAINQSVAAVTERDDIRGPVLAVRWFTHRAENDFNEEYYSLDMEDFHVVAEWIRKMM